MSPDSDVDILVIKSGVPHRRQLAQQIHQAFFGLAVPIDVIVVTPEDVRAFSNKVGTIITRSLWYTHLRASRSRRLPHPGLQARTRLGAPDRLIRRHWSRSL